MDYSTKTVRELRQICKEHGIKGYSKKKRDELIQLINTNSTKVKSLQADVPVLLELCKIPESVNLEIISQEIKNYITPRLWYYNHKKSALSVESGFSEHFVAISTKGIEIGDGNGGMDVKTSLSEGIDVTCLNMNKNESNEKSLIQNFKKAGLNLDTLFTSGQDTKAVKLFTSDYLKKIEDTKEKENLNEMYILSFISTLNEIYLVCFKFNLENIRYVSSGGFVGNNYININVNNVINSNYGNVKLYKSKKRLELRLHKSTIKHEYAVKIYNN